jgi:hypothetical protein
MIFAFTELHVSKDNLLRLDNTSFLPKPTSVRKYESGVPENKAPD